MSRTVVAEKEVVINRVFNAPLDLVWAVWTEAEHVKKWFGPHMFTIPFCEWDAVPGGKINLHMQGPDGTVFPMLGEFREVVPKERLSFFSDVPDGQGGIFLESLATVTFHPKGDKTEVVVTAKGSGFQEISKQMLEGMEPGWSQSLEKFETHLADL